MPSVLITGAGRGIGRALTEHMSERGWDVYAAARSEAVRGSLALLPRVHPIELDITNRAHVAGLDDLLPERLDGVVNNAGVFVNGPLEAIAVDDLARQLDVNVVSHIAVTQTVLPRIRRSGGRVVFISSTSGLYATPGTGAYNASKFAIEALGDALRIELRPWKIPVSLVEPGPINTGVWGDAIEEYDRLVDTFSPENRELYSAHFAGTRKLLATVAASTSDPSTVARAVEHALTKRWPRRRYLLDAASRTQKAFFAAAPSAVTDAVLDRLTRARSAAMH